MRTSRRHRPSRVKFRVRRISSRPRSIPAALVPGSELIHLGGGETVSLQNDAALSLSCSATPADRHESIRDHPSQLALPPARVHVLPDAVIYPGSRLVGTDANHIIIESLLAEDRSSLHTPTEVTYQPTYIPGTVAVYRSPRRGHSHTLIDDLPRAALLGHAALRRLGPITIVHDGPLSPAEAYLLPRLLGRGIRLVEVEPNAPVTGDRVLLPSHVTRVGVGAVPSWYRTWAERSATLAPRSTGPTRLFVERTTGGRQIRNRTQLEALLEAFDITTVDPAALPMASQVALFRDAELVVGVHGGGLANVLFSRGASVIELVPSRMIQTRYLGLAASKGLDYRGIPAADGSRRADLADRFSRDVTVDLDSLEAALNATDGMTESAPG